MKVLHIGQMIGGLDMSLQNPYGHDFFGGVFPNGKTFGVDVTLL